jgi:predicted dehydrogenase
MARYQMEFAFYAPDRRLTLSFPSPFLRSAPTVLAIDGGEADGPHAWRTEEVASYAESFKQELLHFHDCIATGRAPVTSAADALHDIALCRAVVASHRSRLPRDMPTAV